VVKNDRTGNKGGRLMEQENNLTECMCDFCGQVLQADEKTMRKARQDSRVAAKLICDCDEAKAFCGQYSITEKGIAMVNNICGRKSERPLEAELVNILHSGVGRIAKGQQSEESKG